MDLDVYGIRLRPREESHYESGEEDETTLDDIQAQSIGFDTSIVIKRRIELQMAKEAAKERDWCSDDEEEASGGEECPKGETEGFINHGIAGDSVLTNSLYSGLNEDGFAITGRQKGVDVVKELKLLCMEHDKGRDVTYLAIELNSFKFSQNATYSDCCTGAILALLEVANITLDKKPLEVIKRVEAELKYWSPLFKKLTQGIEEERAIITAIESLATGGNSSEVAQVLAKEPTFRCVLEKLHDFEYVSEEAILAWAAQRRRDEEDDENNPLVKLFLQQATQDFLDWLEEESDSYSDDDDD